jgi:hypothetical protein
MQTWPMRCRDKASRPLERKRRGASAFRQGEKLKAFIVGGIVRRCAVPVLLAAALPNDLVGRGIGRE